MLNRAAHYHNDHPFSLPPLFKEKGVTHVILSGDLTTTSSKAEYRIAKRFVSLLEREGMEVFAIPGNHDHYTKHADRMRLFYSFFNTAPAAPLLKERGVALLPLTIGWKLLLMDTSCATPLISSSGHFSKRIERHLKELLNTLEKKERVLLVNHFPFFQNDIKRRQLVRGEALEALLSTYPQVQLYLHGHTHRQRSPTSEVAPSLSFSTVEAQGIRGVLST